jgi:hypothetical protein
MTRRMKDCPNFFLHLTRHRRRQTFRFPEKKNFERSQIEIIPPPKTASFRPKRWPARTREESPSLKCDSGRRISLAIEWSRNNSTCFIKYHTHIRHLSFVIQRWACPSGRALLYKSGAPASHRASGFSFRSLTRFFLTRKSFFTFNDVTDQNAT